MERRQQLRDFHYAEAVKRGWLPSGGTSEAKLDLLKSFLGVSELVNASASAHFRSKAPSNAAYLWLSQVRQVADRLTADEFDEGQMPELVTRLKGLMADEHGVSAVVEVFASFGVRLVLLRALPGMRVDGAVVWDDRGPVIALTLRFDRIDWFWFTLMHEVAHVFLGHRETVVDVVKDAASSSSRADLERAADAKAGEWLIPMEPYNAFVARSAGYFTLSSVRRFADAIQRHPGIVVGRLQHDDFIGFDKLRAELVPVSKRLGGWIAE
jgi:HTH-type transcriptional regulator/antitoxin HigA